MNAHVMPALGEADAVRFWAKVSRDDGCWLWVGARDSDGYGAFRVDGKMRRAHRVAWALARGAVDPALQVDHNCHTEALTAGQCSGGRCIHRSCVNPAHLRLVSNLTNSLCGDSFAALNATVTHCPEGHEYSLQNTMSRQGRRRCRECHIARNQVTEACACGRSVRRNHLRKHLSSLVHTRALTGEAP